MYNIERQIINSVGNIQCSEHVAFIDATTADIIEDVSKHYNALARAETLRYKLTGQDYYIRYAFKKLKILSINHANNNAINLINAEVKAANEYINRANRAYSISNKRRMIADDSLKLKPVRVDDIMFGHYDSKHCIIDTGVDDKAIAKFWNEYEAKHR